MDQRHEFMGKENILNLIIKFSVPAMIGMSANALYNLVDRIYIGNIKEIGHLAISGLGLVYPVILLVFSFGLLIGVGNGTNVSINLGRKDKEKAEEFIGTTVLLVIILSTTISFLIYYYAKEIVALLGGSKEISPYAIDYLKIVSLGFFPLTLSYVLNFCIRADGSPKTAMFTILLGAAINVVLDPLFIFTFGMGIKGAALATVLSQITSALWVLYYFISRHSGLKIKVKNFKFEYHKIIKIMTLGSSSFVIQLSNSIIMLVMNIYLKKYGGDLSVGAFAIINIIAIFILLPVVGINQGVQPIIAYNYGAQLYQRVKETLIKAMIIATIVCVVGFIGVQLFAEGIISLFAKKKELFDIALYGIKIQTLLLPIVGFQIIASVYFLSIENPRVSLLISLLRQTLVLIPCIILLATLFGLKGIWYAQPTSDLISALFVLFLLKREFKKLRTLI